MRRYIDRVVTTLKPFTTPLARVLLSALTRIEKLDESDVKDFDDKEEMIIEQFEDVFAWESLIYGAILAVFAVLSWQLTAAESISMQVVGLSLSALGSLSLARSSVRGKAGIVANVQETASRQFNAATKSIPDEGALRAKCRNTVHGVFGALILAAGFIVQITASV
ncbi:hypothetical protein [Halobacterium salinarum]|uniref:hypothetical protein n=1 Tax=Halobacterium salinarum TaxID=2242 RepID=UPI0025555035|nr:hypothetical protein [Halobacterium salinarum]MDL0134749.1 hypothetical protein [Halobacterium salinarum]